MSRIGKIARLPRAVREELNRRLEDGEEGKGLVAWLNGHTEVQTVLKAEFEGKPVNEPNLTAWRQGGFEDWRRQQESIEAAGRVAEETDAIAETMAAGDKGRPAVARGYGEVGSVTSLVDRVSMMAALALGQELMAVRRMEDGDAKRRAVLKLVRGLVRLRKSDREQERGMREAAEAARAAEVHEDWAERMRPRSRADARGEMSEVRRKMTDVIAGMSDEEIEETLQMGGYLPGVELRGKRVWWTEEDEALDGDDDEAEDYEEDEEEEDPPPAKAARTLNAERVTPNAQVTSSSGLPPEGGNASTLLRQGYGGQASAEGADPSGRPPSSQGFPLRQAYGGQDGEQATNDGRADGGGLIQS